LIASIAARSIGWAAAEEIVQDVFVAVWRKSATFDPARGTFRTWILRIAHLRVLNELRRRGRRPQVAADPEEDLIGNAPEPGPGPEEAAWLAQRGAVVRAAVAALPEHQRQALTLAFLEDMTHQQIAESLGLPLGTAKTRIRVGLQSLRVHLAPLLAAGLIVLGLLATFLVREGISRAAFRRQEAALRLVTSSEVVPLRLVAVPGSGTPPETHGNYRGRPGSEIAVMTVSRLRPAPAGRIHRAWGMFGGRWHLLGTVAPGADGSALLISEGPHLAALPTALEVTLEPVGSSMSPDGPSEISWPIP
jgi:RNA polymerase sigma-70 factor (ECF subfamily)